MVRLCVCVWNCWLIVGNCWTYKRVQNGENYNLTDTKSLDGIMGRDSELYITNDEKSLLLALSEVFFLQNKSGMM